MVARDAAPLCVAGVALGDIHHRFMWQAWHLATSTVVLRGRRGLYDTLVVSGDALGPRWSPVTHFAWQAWHLVTSTVVSRGRRGTWRHPTSFAWPRWHLWHFGTCHSCTHHLCCHLSHTSLSYTIFHTHTHIFVTHHLSHTIFVTQHLSHLVVSYNL